MIPARLLVTTLLRSGIRPALRYSQSQRPASIPHQRQFSATPWIQAAEPDIGAFTAAFRKTEIFKKVASNPEAIKALEDFALVLQNSGIDLTSGKQPSMLKMAKLAMNSDFREGMKRVAEEFQKAGIDMSSPDVINELMQIKKAAEGSK